MNITSINGIISRLLVLLLTFSLGFIQFGAPLKSSLHHTEFTALSCQSSRPRQGAGQLFNIEMIIFERFIYEPEK